MILRNQRYVAKVRSLAMFVSKDSKLNKKFGLMLTRRVKAYSSSCLQTVGLSLAISSQFILEVCAAADNHKNQ